MPLAAGDTSLTYTPGDAETRAPGALFSDHSPECLALQGARRRFKRPGGKASRSGDHRTTSSTPAADKKKCRTETPPKKIGRSKRATKDSEHRDRSAARMVDQPIAAGEELDFRHSGWWERRQR